MRPDSICALSTIQNSQWYTIQNDFGTTICLLVTTDKTVSLLVFNKIMYLLQQTRVKCKRYVSIIVRALKACDLWKV